MMMSTGTTPRTRGGVLCCALAASLALLVLAPCVCLAAVEEPGDTLVQPPSLKQAGDETQSYDDGGDPDAGKVEDSGTPGVVNHAGGPIEGTPPVADDPALLPNPVPDEPAPDEPVPDEPAPDEPVPGPDESFDTPELPEDPTEPLCPPGAPSADTRTGDASVEGTGDGKTGEDQKQGKPPVESSGLLRATVDAQGVVVASAAVQAPARPANAVDVAEGTYVLETNVANDKVVDAAGKKPRAGGNVASWTYNGGANQVWRIIKDLESAWYRLICGVKGSELALGLTSSGAGSRNVGLVDPKKAGDAALWSFVRSGSWYRLVNRAAEGFCLEVRGKSKAKGANIQLGRTNQADRTGQAFFLIKTRPSVKGSTGASEGAYALAPTVNGSLVCEVRRASTANGANVIAYRDKGGNHQKLYVESAGKGFYTIWVVGSRKVLAQASSSIMPGTNVVQANYRSSSAAQRWSIVRNNDGTLTFVNQASGLALCVGSGSSGTNVFATRNDGYKTTRFRLANRELLSAGIVEIHPRTSSRVSLDVRRAAASGRADLLLYSDGDKLNQRFELVSVKGANLWRVRTASSGGWIFGSTSGVYQDGKGSSPASKANTWRATFKGGGYSLVNCATGLAMDMRYGKTASGTKIIAYRPNGRDSQHYVFDYTTLIPSGTYFLRNGKGGYLSIEGDRATSGARAQTRSKDNGLGQYFTLERSGRSLRVKNSYSGRYLATSGAKVVQSGRQASSAQLWVARIEDGGRISFATGSNRYLDASSASQVKTASATHAAPQKWQPTKTSFRPYSGYTQRAVDRANASGSETGYLVAVDKSAHRVVVMTGENGSWRPSRDMPCSVGAYETPTVEGSFVVQDRGTSFGEGYTCWYWTQFYRDYLFHSVVYDPGSMSSVQDGRLGMHISHGCVRMDIDDAYWIYANIPSGTRVLIYS